jgi:LPS export ABC transporter protein LptC
VAMGGFVLRTKWIVMLLGLGLSVGLITIYVKGREPASRVETAPMVESAGEMVLTNIEFTEIEQEKRKWTLKATQARYFQEGQKTELEDVHLVLYMSSGDEVELRSETGILHAGSKDIELVGQVHALIAHSYQVNTDYAYYNHKEQKIHSDSSIHVEGPELLLDGGRWQYQVGQQQGTVDGDIKARLIFTPRMLGSGVDSNHRKQPQ